MVFCSRPSLPASPARGLTQQPPREPRAEPRLGAAARGQAHQRRGRGWCRALPGAGTAREEAGAAPAQGKAARTSTAPARGAAGRRRDGRGDGTCWPPAPHPTPKFCPPRELSLWISLPSAGFLAPAELLRPGCAGPSCGFDPRAPSLLSGATAATTRLLWRQAASRAAVARS